MKNVLNRVFSGAYNKTLTALTVGLIGWGSTVVTSASAPVSAPEWIGLATVVATGLGVYGVANK